VLEGVDEGVLRCVLGILPILQEHVRQPEDSRVVGIM
jgi:hypothetical protein